MVKDVNFVKTYCNPLALPDYQRGRLATYKDKPWGWLNETPRDYREMADPTVIKFQGRWYLFPSCGQLWHSDDMVNWQYHPIEPFDLGYAPTVVQKGEFLYMTACGDQMWRATHPFGPWTLLGTIKDQDGNPTDWNDPMLFVDDDGTMYCYHGLGKDGIYVVRLKNDDPTCFDGPKQHCFAFDPSHRWEWCGEHNQDPSISYIEGSWMNKIGGRYYLNYSAPGTEWKCYGLGCYVSDGPIGPWQYQKRNPILMHRGGMINGCGHGCIVEGPDGGLWCFYTLLVRIEHHFERRVGMDPVGIDANGEIFVAGPTETPQLAPGIKADAAMGNEAGWMNVSANRLCRASSSAPGRDAVYAIDDNIRTWWEAEGPGPQWLQVDLGREFVVTAARTLFGDRGLDYDGGVVPGPYRYRIEGSVDREHWFVLIDQSGNTVDRHIAYDTCPTAQAAHHVRLVILEAPKGMRISVWEFTVFGTVTA